MEKKLPQLGIFLVILFLLSNAMAGDYKIGTKSDLQKLLKKIPASFKKEFWYGEVASKDRKAPCGFEIKGKDGKILSDGLSLFIGDIDNGGEPKYILVTRCSGTIRADTILEVFRKEDSLFTPIGFWKVLEKDGLDGSNLPMNIDNPFLSKENGKTIIHFTNPKEKWIWEGDKISELKSKKP
jgi:hypothetical protein